MFTFGTKTHRILLLKRNAMRMLSIYISKATQALSYVKAISRQPSHGNSTLLRAATVTSFSFFSLDSQRSAQPQACRMSTLTLDGFVEGITKLCSFNLDGTAGGSLILSHDDKSDSVAESEPDHPKLAAQNWNLQDSGCADSGIG